MSSKNHLLVLIGTHGDEADLGKKAIEALNRRRRVTMLPKRNESDSEICSWMLANPKAAKRGIRFLDADLNRVAPGDYKSDLHEVRRAFELLWIAERYEHLIDIHGTPTDSGVFALVTNHTPANVALANSLAVRNVIIWPSRGKIGPLTAHHPSAVELECGPKGRPATVRALADILEKFLWNDGITDTPDPKKRWFRVDGKVMAKDAPLRTVRNWREWKPVTHGGDTFCPILLNKTDKPLAKSSTYDGVRAVKARPIDFQELFPR